MGREPPDTLGSMRSILEAMAETPLPAVGLQPGSVLEGRFRIEERLGMGGMGVVYCAHDAKMGRQVALKLTAYAEGEEQLRREAIALARLSHPNVVTAYEVAELDVGVFIVMELVKGATVRRWLAAKPRSWREIVGVYRQAGEGLAAVHHAGLVHRDVKPDNVLVGEDGRVRVADLGLADDASLPGRVGTVTYMAPEVAAGGVADARSDQYSFCLSLAEALEGAGPPARLRVVVSRGSSAAPEERYPTMDALLADLTRDPTRMRRRALAGMGMLGALALVAWLSATATRKGASDEDPCSGAEDRLAGAWDASVRSAVRDAFAATGRPYAEDSFGRVARHLDGYAAAWTSMHTDVCRATRVRREQSDALYDLRMECLDHRRRALASLTALLAQRPDATVLDRAVFAVAELEEVSGCGDRDALTAAMPPPEPVLRPHVLSLRTRLDGARALLLAGKYREAAPLAEMLAEEARAVPYPPVRAEALYLLVQFQTGARDYAAARRTGADALLAAAQARDDVTTARLWIALLTAANEGERPADAQGLFPAAEAAVARVGGDPTLRAYLRNAQGGVHRTRGDYAAAQRYHEEALRALEQAPHPDDYALARTLSDLGRALMNQSKLDEARAAYERAITVSVDLLGPDHPTVAGYVHNLGNLFNRLGRPEEARERYARALAIWTRVDPEGVDVALEEHTLGRVALVQERYDEARRRFERALAIREKHLGNEHPRVATVLSDLGDVLSRLARHDEAARHAERALAIRRKVFGPDHIEIAHSLADLAVVRLQRGALREALAGVQEAIARAERVLGSQDVVLASFLTIRAEIQSARGRIDLAIEDDARAGHPRAPRRRRAGRRDLARAAGRALRGDGARDRGGAAARARDRHPGGRRRRAGDASARPFCARAGPLGRRGSGDGAPARRAGRGGLRGHERAAREAALRGRALAPRAATLTHSSRRRSSSFTRWKRLRRAAAARVRFTGDGSSSAITRAISCQESCRSTRRMRSVWSSGPSSCRSC